MKFWPALFLCVLMISGCEPITGYIVRDGKVYWKEFAGSSAFPTLERVERPVDADAESFRVEQFKVWASDRTGAFFQGKRVGDVDQASFGALSKRFAKDQSAVFYRIETLEEAHAPSFRILEEIYAADRQYGFYGQTAFALCHPASVRILSVGVHPFAVDDECAFAGGFRIPIQNRSGFRLLGASYSTDGVAVYWRQDVVEGADPASFYVPEGMSYGRDRSGCWLGTRPQTCPE